MTDYKQRLDELVKLRDNELHSYGGIQARQVAGEAITLAEELHAEVERLRGENFTLAAGVCDTARGDEVGTLRCGSKQDVEKLRTAADKMKEALERVLSDMEEIKQRDKFDDVWPRVFASEVKTRVYNALYTYEQARGGER